jgi:SpoVK/Ycf46/Vps4 family AAA+-type ATPase
MNTLATAGLQNQGMNQMLELFKMQYLMKLFDGNKGAGGGMLMMFLLMAYDHFAKSFPALMAFLWLWAQCKWTGKPMYPDAKRDTPLMPVQQQPPPTKTVQAFIQFERHPEKAADPRIDAVMYHVCTLPDVRSLRYNGVEMIPNFKDQLMIENDVWFEILSSTNGPPMVTTVAPGGKAGTVEPILYRLSTYDHDITWLHKFVEQAMDTFEQEKKNKLGSETYYFDQLANGSDSFRVPLPKGLCMFNKSKFQSNRTLKNVYLRQIDDLQGRVEFFMRRRDWYDSKGIPHTLGIVMYGHPGCGKTSTIKAIANETKRHIFNIMLSEIRTKEALKDLFYNEQVHVWDNNKMEVLNIPLKNRLYVIEDIDAMDSVVVKRSKEVQKEDEERKIRVAAEMELLKQQQGEIMAKAMINGKKNDEADKLDLATLLNVLDGVRETPGRIIILSTNYPERLDEALLRPGRFDMMLEFEKHSCTVLQQHIEKHYDITLTPKQLTEIQNTSLNFKWTPAEVSQILFRRHTDPDLAIQDLLKESPEKLFKFSQMVKTNEGESSQLKKAIEDESIKKGAETSDLDSHADYLKAQVQVQQKLEDASTSLEDLLKEEIPELSSSNELVPLKKKVEEEDEEERISRREEEDEYDDIGHISGGLNLVNPDPPTKEQVEAEVKAHRTLFPEQYKDGKYTGPSLKKSLEEQFIEKHGIDPVPELKKTDITTLQAERVAVIEKLISAGDEIKSDASQEMTFMQNSFKLEVFNPVHLPNAGNSEHADRTMLDHMMQSPMFCDDGTGLCAATDFEEGPTSLEECFGGECASVGVITT